MTRDEHVAWCKQRAHQYLDAGDTQQALTSMFRDLRKHPETENHAGIQLGIMLMMNGLLHDPRKFIDGFN